MTCGSYTSARQGKLRHARLNICRSQRWCLTRDRAELTVYRARQHGAQGGKSLQIVSRLGPFRSVAVHRVRDIHQGVGVYEGSLHLGQRGLAFAHGLSKGWTQTTPHNVAENLL